ncbi:hypothetical protein FJK98_21715 [Micromonospora sp. HM134]|uniref:hypothetical protein n=1 Tax=Micromonospora sp. HM134 TaxID=2583243 RepID=UPI0011985A1F|nr:hypothetical protein [Micromonospora sp. HM134]QDY09440.1 hypothetical protein FJK98_21715 [Micromonospora sp. HM134]
MTLGSRLRAWAVALAVGVLVAGLGTFLAIQGLDKADKWGSVLGLFVGLAGLGLAAAGAIGARRQAGGQLVTGSTIGGGVTQVRGVGGNVRIGPAPAQPVVPAPPGSSPSSVPFPSPSGGQVVEGSSTAGPVRQVDGVGGDVELDQ